MARSWSGFLPQNEVANLQWLAVAVGLGEVELQVDNGAPPGEEQNTEDELPLPTLKDYGWPGKVS